MPIDVNTLVTCVLTLTHTRRRCDGGKSVSDCFLPPPYRTLYLSDNQLSVLSADVFAGLTSLR